MAELTERYREALLLAEELHRNQFRKGNRIPYLAHLLRVSGLVLEFGGDEDTAIAALLHDAVEDQGGIPTADLIEQKFGGRIRSIVMECTDSIVPKGEKKRPWKERKIQYIEHLNVASPEAMLICSCDKLDNLSSTLRNYRTEGIQCFARFTGGNAPNGPQNVYDNYRWYYRSIIDILVQKNSPVACELEEIWQTLFADKSN